MVIQYDKKTKLRLAKTRTPNDNLIILGYPDTEPWRNWALTTVVDTYYNKFIPADCAFISHDHVGELFLKNNIAVPTGIKYDNGISTFDLWKFIDLDKIEDNKKVKSELL